MSLYSQLQQVRSEEDVKDAYIKALGLKGYTKGLIDIQTDEIWFEAKDTAKHSSYAMFTQLLHYVQIALNKGEAVPPSRPWISPRSSKPTKPWATSCAHRCLSWVFYDEFGLELRTEGENDERVIRKSSGGFSGKKHPPRMA